MIGVELIDEQGKPLAAAKTAAIFEDTKVTESWENPYPKYTFRIMDFSSEKEEFMEMFSVSNHQCVLQKKMLILLLILLPNQSNNSNNFIS